MASASWQLPNSTDFSRIATSGAAGSISEVFDAEALYTPRGRIPRA
jgi:hypothetical protein